MYEIDSKGIILFICALIYCIAHMCGMSSVVLHLPDYGSVKTCIVEHLLKVPVKMRALSIKVIESSCKTEPNEF
jgi:hypothetical protein